MPAVITTRELRDSDIPGVLELMRLSLGETAILQRTADLFAWKHLSNPFGRSIALVAESGDELVGLRTFMRWELDAPGEGRLRCIRAVDTATHPGYQRRGIFSRLTEEAVEVARADTVDLVFNTPNEKSRPGYLKMGWQLVGPIGAMVRPGLGMLRHSGSTDLDASLFLRDPVPFRGFDYTDRAALGLRTPRTRDYPEWRFASHPTAAYNAVASGAGTAVVRPNLRGGRRELVIADLLGRPAPALRAVSRQLGSAYGATWFSSGSPERRAALRSGYFPVPGLAALTLVMRPLRDMNPDLGSLRAWDVAVSDFELL